MKKVLLHICCGICASTPIQRLKKEGFEVIGFFYNPNIHPKKEYEQRLKVTLELAKFFNIQLITGPYEEKLWSEATQDLASEPEGGERCKVCFRLRLEKTSQLARHLNIPSFTTTLTTSPHKRSLLINQIGKDIDSQSFLERDFKKMQGFKEAIFFSKKHRFYIQKYCGCIYSRREVFK